MPLDFPTIERTTLSNGLRVTYAQRKAAPLTHVLLSFDAGDGRGQPRRARPSEHDHVCCSTRARANRTSQQIAEEKERLGANLA